MGKSKWDKAVTNVKERIEKICGQFEQVAGGEEP